MQRALFKPSTAAWALIALVAGAALGLVGQAFELPLIAGLSNALAPVGTLWLNALQMAVLPLVVARLLATLIRVDDDSSVAKIGQSTLTLFFVYLGVASLITALVTSQALALFPLPADMIAGFKLEKAVGAADAVVAAPLTFAEWAKSLVPRNPFDAAARGNILQMLVFTVFFGMAAGRLPKEPRALLAQVVNAIADAMMIMVSWIMVATPAGVFVLMLGMMLQSGTGTLGLIAVYVVALCAMLTLIMVLVYPATAIFGRISLRQFARGVAPAQLVAAGTQSSLASLPAMVKSGQERLGLPTQATGFVLTLAVSTFKLNQAVSPMFKFILLAHVYAIPIGVREIAVFGVAAILLSFGVAGIPRGNGGSSTLPLYIAAGIPVEGVILLEAVKTIPDVFMTMLNVTGDMSVATVLSRNSRTTVTAPMGVPVPTEPPAATAPALT